MTAVLLALLTAVAYGLANYLGPVLTRTRPLAGVLLVAQTIGLAGAVLLVAVVGGAAPHGVALVEGLLAGAFNGLALATLYPAAAAGPMSIVAPIGATGAVVPVVVALAAGERPSALQLVGIPVALVGVVLAAARDSGGGAHAAPRTLALAALSAVAFGAFLTFFGRASHAGPAWAVLTSRAALLTCTLGVVLGRRPPVRVPVGALPLVAVPGVLLLAGTVSYGAASTRGLTSVVSVLATLSPVVTVGLAVALLGERLVGRQRVGVLTALGGVVLLAAG